MKSAFERYLKISNISLIFEKITQRLMHSRKRLVQVRKFAAQDFI